VTDGVEWGRGGTSYCIVLGCEQENCTSNMQPEMVFHDYLCFKLCKPVYIQVVEYKTLHLNTDLGSVYPGMLDHYKTLLYNYDT